MKYMITSKDKPLNHPINYVHNDLESFVLYSDSFNDLNSQLVEVEDIPEITKNFKAVLDQERQRLDITAEQSTFCQQHKIDGQQAKVEEQVEFQHLEDEVSLWSMDFDGAVGKDGAGIGSWLRSLTFLPNKVPSNVRVCSYKLAFDCSNNEAEYEALIAGLKILKNLNAKRVSVYGDSELVIKQVKGEYEAKNPLMQAYYNVVLDILRLFLDYTLTCVPRVQNVIADSLATAASNLKILMNSNNKFEIHVKHRPTIPYNQRYWQVFQDDKEIEEFLQNEGKYKDTSIDGEQDGGETDIEVNQMEVLQLKENVIPKHLIPLEELFDQDDVARKPILVPTEKGVEDVNIGTTENPKMVKLSNAWPPQVKEKYISLLSSFTDVFAWDYLDLKAYNKSIIQHIIPIKPNQKPFRQKLRRINPKLLPSIEKEVNRLYKAGIIVPIRFSDWISNLVTVRKKTCEIRSFGLFFAVNYFPRCQIPVKV